MIEEIQSLAAQFGSEIIAARRHLHQHPELSYQEFETQKFVSEKLQSFGIASEVKAVTGLTAEIRGRNSGSLIALRADMDALPIEEANHVPYKSKNKGVMHACGHDVHTACLLGAAHILNEMRSRLDGTIRLIFQPGEEKNPGGASYMIKEGILTPAPKSILGQHVFPLLPAGKIGFREGKYMASSDEIYLAVKGKGGHGAAPELTIDPVVILSHIIIALQQVVSRKAGPKQPTVLTFGKLKAEGSTNVIPDEAFAAGTFRTMDETWRAQGLEWISKTAKMTAQSMGGECEVTISHGYPCLTNDIELTRRIKASAELYAGKENVTDIDYTLSSEDFAYYSQVIPASFYRLGTANAAKGITSYVHTPTFDVDESALPFGAGLMAWLAVQELRA